MESKEKSTNSTTISDIAVDVLNLLKGKELTYLEVCKVLDKVSSLAQDSVII